MKLWHVICCKTNRLPWVLAGVVLGTAVLSSCGSGGGGGSSGPPTEVPAALQPLVTQLQPKKVWRWSDPRSHLPLTDAEVSGDKEVVIPAGTLVILDVSPPALPHLSIEGTLVFEDATDVELRAASIAVDGGRLQIGTAEAPHSHQATITLHGPSNPADTGVDNDGISRGLNVRGGTLALYGQVPEVVWTQLNDHLPAKAKTATLKEAVNWPAGAQIVVAPTDFYNQAQTERTTLAADANGNQLSLDSGVAVARWGKLQYPTATGMSLTPDASYRPPVSPAPTVLDERAEVGLLSRRIVIQGADDADWRDKGFGAHLMIMDLRSQVVIDGVEFRRAGQAGKLARYPVHWHLLSYNTSTGAELGDASGHVIRRSAIWNSAQRCIVIHATNGVQVQNNICHDIVGHAIFLEDAVERRNLIQNNLVLKVRSPSTARLLKIHEGPQVYQAGPSGLWLTQPDNTVTGNHFADAHGNGLWLSFPLRSLGLSRQVPFYPKFMRLGKVADNVAHSNGGPGQLLEWVPVDDKGDRPEATKGTLVGQMYNPMSDDQVCYDSSGNIWDYCNRQARFEVLRSVLYKNGSAGSQGAYRNRASLPDYLEWTTADNAGTHFAGSVGNGSIQRALLVGQSLNVGLGYPSNLAPPSGLATYHSSVDMAQNTLINFPFVANTTSGAFLTDDYYIRPLEKGSARNAGNQLIASHAGYRSLPPLLQPNATRAENWALAGALWDPHGYWGAAGNYLVFNTPFLTAGMSCQNSDGATAGDGANGRTCSGEYYGVTSFQTDIDTSRYVFSAAIDVVRQDSTGAQLGTWRVGDGYTTWVDSNGKTQSCNVNSPPPVGTECSWKLGNMRHFAAVPGGRYVLNFPTHPRAPRFLTFNIENAYRTSDSLLFSLPFDGSFTAQGHHISGRPYNREYPLFDPAGHPNSTTSKPTSTRYLKHTTSLANVLADTTGTLMWQDKANHRVWLRYVGYSYSAQSQAALAPTTEDGLYYAQSVMLYPQGACAGMKFTDMEACLQQIKAMSPP